MEFTSDSHPINESLVKYTVFKSIQWYRQIASAQEGALLTPADFNERNNFTKAKILKIPFFLVMGGNGGTEDLYREFGPFYATNNGPGSLRLTRFWEKFSLENQELFGIRFSEITGQIHIVDEDRLADIGNLDRNLMERVDKAVQNIRNSIEDLIRFSDFELLVMCHQFEASFVYRLNHPSDFKIQVHEIKQDSSRTFFSAGDLLKVN